MSEVLASLLDLSVLIFAVSSMLSVGFSYTLRGIIDPLRNFDAVFRTLLANFVLVPLLAYVIVQSMPLDRAYAIGLFFVASAAGAPFLIKLTERASGNVAISATLLVLLLPFTVIYMPIMVPAVLPYAEVDPLAIASPLVLTMLLPLAAGLLVRAKARTWAERLQPVMSQASSIALLVLMASTVLLNLREILGIFGTGAILAVLLVIGGAFAIGWILGGPIEEARNELALATAQRNIAAATVVATQSVAYSDTIVMVVVTSLVGLAILFPIASALRKRETRRAEAKGLKLSMKRQ